MSIKSYNDVYEIYAWEDNNRTFKPTIGEGGIKYIRLILKDRQGIISLEDRPTISYVITKANGRVSSVEATILNNGINGEIEIPIKPCLTDHPGLAKGTVRLTTADGILKFYGVNLDVLEDANDTQIENSSEFSDLVQALQSLDKALQKVSSLTASGEIAVLDDAITKDSKNPVVGGIIFQYLLDNYVSKTQKIAGIELSGNIPVSSLQKALFYPILESSKKPTSGNHGEVGQFWIRKNNDTETIYMCVKQNLATNENPVPTYEWIEFPLANNVVPVIRKIAGLNLSADITVTELTSALKTYPVKKLNVDPTLSSSNVEGEIGQLGYFLKYENLRYVGYLYICRGVTDGEYEWVLLSGALSITDEQIALALEKYLDENPLPGGGSQGEDGKSAYQIAVDNGFEGTEEEWLNSLRGSDGVSVVSVSQIRNTKVNPVENSLVIRLSNGEESIVKFLDGVDGKDGTGVADVTISDTGELSVELTNGTVLNLGNIKGANGTNGVNGADGYTPVKGVDYFTQSDKAELVDSLIDETGILQEMSYNEVTNNLNDAVYEYGYLNTDGSNHDTFNPISTTFRTKNYIPVNGGSRLCFNHLHTNYFTNVRLCQYNANKECIVERTELEREVNKWTNNGITLNANTKYVRFTCYAQFEDLSTIEINMFYYENRAEMWDSAGNGFVYLPHLNSEYIGEYVPVSKIQSPLTGKKIVYDGDSICYGAGYRGGYAKIIAEKTGGKYENFSQGGARLTHKPDDKTYHSLVDNLINLPTDGDLYCFEGGINDYWTPKELGTFSKTDFTGTLDTNTICGALETIFRYALNTFVGKAIVFVIPHKIQTTAYAENANGDTFEDYRNAMVGICEKYSIPYYDAFSKSGLNGWNTTQSNAFLTGSSDGSADGCHPNEEGYKRYYAPQLISLFERYV